MASVWANRPWHSSVLSRYVLHVRLLWRSAPLMSLCCLALTVLMAAATTATLVATGRLVGAVQVAMETDSGPAAADTAWRWFALTAVLFIVIPLAATALAVTAHAVAAKYLVTVLDMTMELGTHPYGIAHLEQPKSAGQLEAVAKAPSDWLFVAGIHTGWTLLSIRLSGVGAFFVVADWSLWVALLVVVGWQVLSSRTGRWSNMIFDDLLDVTGNDRRRATYLRSLLMGSRSAKEIRIFGLTQWLADRYVAAWQQAMQAVWANRAQGVRGTLLVLLFPLATNSVAVGLLARDVWVGTVTTGALVTLAQGVLTLSAFGAQNEPQAGLARTTAVVSELARLREEYGLPLLPGVQPDRLPQADEPAVLESTPAGDGGLDGRAASIDWNSVTFTYPSEEKPTLSGLSLHIPAGQSVALVGVNGIGKSTLIKLLCGLYRPDSGVIKIDDGDPGVDQHSRRKVAVIFQEFVRYQLPLQVNVGVGTLEHSGDQQLLEGALSDASAGSLLTELESGWETILSSEYDGGTDLSGGQWQRVALARAFAALRGGASVLVLDEPTSALDVRAEAALFERFLEVTRGCTTLLVSHRLSSVRHAERIVVLGRTAEGATQVVEDGSHEELLAINGEYSKLFTLQASRFAMDTEGQ